MTAPNDAPPAAPRGIAEDPRAELASLVASARSWVEWQEECGSDGVISEAPAVDVLAMFERKARAKPPSRAASPAPAPPARPTAAVAFSPPAAPAASEPRLSPLPEVTHAPTLPIVGLSPLDQAPLGPDERRAKLTVLAGRVAACTRCELHTTRKQTVFSRGNPDAELCFIGEGPGADEDAQGLPFVGKAGQLLDRMIEAMGLKRDEDIYVANIVKCRPPNNRVPDPTEMASCMPYLLEQLGVTKPKVIVALGATAVRGLIGQTDGITKIRGTWRLFHSSIPLMPTFHPAFVLRQPTKEIRGMVWSDLQQVLRQLGRPVPTRGA